MTPALCSRPAAKWIWGAIPFIAILLVWQLVTSMGWVKPFFLPSPWEVIQSLTERSASGALQADLWKSFVRVGIGYFLAALLGIPIGIALGTSGLLRSLGEPLNNFVRYTPLPAFVPLVILWVGLGDGNAITLVFLGAFWSLIVLVADAVSSVPHYYTEAARTLGLGRFQCLRRVVIPNAMPGIYDALRLSFGLAWASLVLAEVAGANVGLGHMLMEAQRFLKTATVLGGVLLVGILGMIADLLFAWGYKHLFPWTERVRHEKRKSSA